MDHKLFCKAYYYVLQRLTEKPEEIFDCEPHYWNENDKALSWSFEDEFNIAVTVVFRMGIPYIDTACIEGGDLAFIFESFGVLEDNNLDNGLMPYSSWSSERDACLEHREDQAYLTQRIIQDMIGVMDYFKKTVQLIETLVQ